MNKLESSKIHSLKTDEKAQKVRTLELWQTHLRTLSKASKSARQSNTAVDDSGKTQIAEQKNDR